jgi:hypothetical protein
MVIGTVGMAVKYATGMPTRSISVAIVASQRLAVPQVALRRTASIPSLRRSSAISRPLSRAGDGRHVPHGHVEVLVDVADPSLALELEDHVERHDAVRVAPDLGGVEAAVHGGEAVGAERVELGDPVLHPLRRSPRLHPVGIAVGNEAGLGDEGESRLREVPDGRRGRHVIEGRQRELGAEGLAAEPRDEHRRHALGARARVEDVAPVAARHVALDVRRPRRQAPGQREPELRHGLEGRAHAARGGGRLDDVDVAVARLDAGILGEHRAHHGDPELLRDRAAEGRAGQAEAAGVEGGTQEDHRRALGLDQPHELVDDLAGAAPAAGRPAGVVPLQATVAALSRPTADEGPCLGKIVSDPISRGERSS